MSEYTTELRFICESLAGLNESQGGLNVDEIIEKARTKLFSFNYDIFSSDYKKILETKIIRHFYFRELAYETYGFFKLKLEIKMNEIMPYFNELYLSKNLVENPLTDYSKTRTSSRKDESKNDETNNDNAITTTLSTSTNATSNTTSSEDKSENIYIKKQRYSDTPQSGLTGIENDTYLTNVTLNNDSDRSNANHSSSNSINDSFNSKQDVDTTSERSKVANGTTTSDFTESENGRNQSESDLLLRYRETFINIDMMIINELEELFLQIW